ncbi:MAG TPA: TIGR02678 family protein, partial [Bacillota bacterium]
MREFEALLENFWIIKEQNQDLYQQVKDALPALKPVIENKLGYRLVVTPYFIKMEKIPGQAEAWMGIRLFDQPLEYALLCLLLAFLEDYGAQEQFILSQLTEFLQSTFPDTEKVDWTLYRHRLSLVKVLNFAVEMGFIKVDYGDNNAFSSEPETEVLYEATGLSRYFVRNFSQNILSYQNWQDLERDEGFNLDPDRGALRRHRVYRRLFLSPVLLSEGPDDPDFLYLKNFRTIFQKDVEALLGGALHIHKTAAVLLLDAEKNFKDTLPDQKVISGIAIQVCTELRRLVTAGVLTPGLDDTILIARDRLEKVIDTC